MFEEFLMRVLGNTDLAEVHHKYSMSYDYAMKMMNTLGENLNNFNVDGVREIIEGRGTSSANVKNQYLGKRRE
jgi:hypothetical protein